MKPETPVLAVIEVLVYSGQGELPTMSLRKRMQSEHKTCKELGC